MATKYYGVSSGFTMPTDVQKSASTTSRPIELVVNDASTDKAKVLMALEAIRNFILTDTWPPA